jgi:hypothetical protein
MSKHAHEQLAPHLHQGETLLWCGRPVKGFRISAGTFPMGVVLLIVSFIWLAVVRRAFEEGGDEWVGATFFTLTAAAFWLPPLTNKLRLRRAVYGVTDRRVIIADSVFNHSARSIDYGKLYDVQLIGSRELGTIHCSRKSMAWKDQSEPGRIAHPALFRRISDAGTAYDLIVERCARVAD